MSEAVHQKVCNSQLTIFFLPSKPEIELSKTISEFTDVALVSSLAGLIHTRRKRNCT